MRLRAIGGARRGQEFEFSGPRVRVGRSRDNDFILADRETPLASGHHAELLLDSNGRWTVVDLGSRNGTRLNDVVIERQALRSGDHVAFGDEEFVVSLADRRSTRWIAAGTVALVLLLTAAGVLLRQILENRAPFEDLSARVVSSVYLIALEDNGHRTAVGTAFAISSAGLLATNAHVAAALHSRGLLPADARTSRVVAVQGDTFASRHVVSAIVHPGWVHGSLRDDAAVLQLEPGNPTVALRVADAGEINALRRGAALATFGFPAASTDPSKPRGRLSVDVVGDVRGDYMEVGLAVAPGTSGSPVFDRSGAVVAIVAGGDFVEGPTGRQPSGSAVNWAISAMALRDLH